MASLCLQQPGNLFHVWCPLFVVRCGEHAVVIAASALVMF